MTREEAINEVKKAMPTFWKETKEAIKTLIPELAESEDERIRKAICAAICCSTAEFVLEANGVKLIDALAYLEKQTGAQPGDEDRYMEGYMNGMNDALKEQKPAEWSEEDEHRRQQSINVLERNGFHVLTDWLKSLRPSWRPSEEQMKALLSKLPVVRGGGDKVQDILESLYDDLKKL